MSVFARLWTKVGVIGSLKEAAGKCNLDVFNVSGQYCGVLRESVWVAYGAHYTDYANNGLDHGVDIVVMIL